MFTKSKKREKRKCGNFERLYQYSDGSFLPDSSQPDPTANFEITSKLYTPHKSTRYVNIIISGNSNVEEQKDTYRKLPELYSDREECCGCTACYSICPVHAIAMRPCEEGFLYPVVDAKKCIR